MGDASKVIDDAYEAGYERGLAVPDMMLAQQLDALIDALAYQLRMHTVGPTHWALLRTMSQVNAQALLSPERAWHNRRPSAQQRSKPPGSQ